MTPACLVVTNIAAGAGGHGFDYRVGLSGHSVANGSPPLQCIFGKVLP